MEVISSKTKANFLRRVRTSMLTKLVMPHMREVLLPKID